MTLRDAISAAFQEWTDVKCKARTKESLVDLVEHAVVAYVHSLEDERVEAIRRAWVEGPHVTQVCQDELHASDRVWMEDQ